MKLNKFLKGILPTIALTGGMIATTVSCSVVKKDTEKKPETPKKDTQTAPEASMPESGIETKPGDKEDAPKPPTKEEEKETLKSDAPSDKTQDASVKKEFTFEKLKVSGSDFKFALKVKNDSTLTLSSGEKLFLTVVVNKLNESGESAKQETFTLQGEKVEGQTGFGVKETFTFTGTITDEEIVKGQKFFQVSSLKKGTTSESATDVRLTQENVDAEFLN